MKSLDVQIVITSENFTQRGTGSGQENSKGTNGTSPASPQGLPTAGRSPPQVTAPGWLSCVLTLPPSEDRQSTHVTPPHRLVWGQKRKERGTSPAPRPREPPRGVGLLCGGQRSSPDGRCPHARPRAWGPRQGQARVGSVRVPGGVRALFTQGSGELGDSPLFPRSNPRVLGLRGALQGGAGPSSRSGVSYPGPGAMGLCEVAGAERGWRGAVAPVADARPHARLPPQ